MGQSGVSGEPDNFSVSPKPFTGQLGTSMQNFQAIHQNLADKLLVWPALRSLIINLSSIKEKEVVLWVLTRCLAASML